MTRSRSPTGTLGALLAIGLLVLLCLPLLGLASASSLGELRDGAAHPMFAPALWLSLRTTLVSLLLTILSGTPLAWWLATSRSRLTGPAETLVSLPIVIPPAVVGVALLLTFGRRGLVGPLLNDLGISLPFTEAAVLMAQVVVSAPFYVNAAAAAFRRVEPSTLVVARTLGASPSQAFFRVAIPMALPGLSVGAALAWARSLGEFGATLLFAGNLGGTTQTMPLAIFSALETDVRLAVVFSLVLAAVSAALLVVVRRVPHAWLRREGALDGRR